MKAISRIVASATRVIRATALMTAVVTVSAGSVFAQSKPFPASPSLSGVWMTMSATGKLVPIQGGSIPFSDKGAEAYAKVTTDIAAGRIVDPAGGFCIPEGFPRSDVAPNPFEILQSPGQVTFIYEANSGFRQVPLDVEHIAERDVIPSFRGRAVGHWDGATLVVDSIGFNNHTWLDNSGLPHGEKLHLIERFRKIDGGKRLENLMTIDDREYYSKAWTARVTYEPRPDIQIEDFSCGENRPHEPRSSSRGVASHAP